MVSLSMYYFYWIMNNSVLACALSEIELGGRIKLNAGKRKVVSERCHVFLKCSKYYFLK